MQKISKDTVNKLKPNQSSLKVDPKRYPSITGGLKIAYAAEGLSGIKIGWVPTAIGYSA